MCTYLHSDPVEVGSDERAHDEDSDFKGSEHEAKVPDLQPLLHSLPRIERGLQQIVHHEEKGTHYIKQC